MRILAKMKLNLIVLLFAVSAASATAYGQAAVVGNQLPAWKEGYLDLHHINTGWGDAAFYIFPDGTTMLFDAGEINPTDPRAFTPRNASLRPNYSKKPYAWIAHYIKQVSPLKEDAVIDYAAISHFHDDHFGSWYAGAPRSATGKYDLTGITGVGELVPVKLLLDRGYPDYDYPYDLKKTDRSGEINFNQTMNNYLAFIYEQQNKGMKAAQVKAGSIRQIRLKNKPSAFPGFHVRNVKSNGFVWSGKDSSVIQLFPPLDKDRPGPLPGENGLSIVFTIHYGSFIYYSGGDCAGVVSYGDPDWKDVETPLARAIGEVDVATLDHHGNRDAVNDFQVSTFKPSVWIQQSWSSDHPGEEVIRRLTTRHLYDAPRDLFATNILEANKLFNGTIIERSYKSMQGHIVVRVLPGGKEYYVIILDDSREDIPVKAVFGPYQSKNK